MPTVEQVAKICHQANKAYCETINDNSQVAWEIVPENIRRSAINGVQAFVDGRVTNPVQSHENWLQFKKEDGWVYGPTKDLTRKTHPCMVDYHSLPDEQKNKDELFFAICRALLEPF